MLAEIIRQVAILVQPLMPDSAERMLDQLGVVTDQRSFVQIGGATRLASGHVIAKPEPVFPRYVEEEAV